MRKSLIMLAKLAAAVALLAWLWATGKLDLSHLSIFASHIELGWLALIYWCIGPMLLASMRWRLLLQGAGYVMSLWRSIRLQWIGFFFATVLPGSLGGDFVKVFYLIKDNPGKSRSLAVWSILLDRIIGMCGLFSVGAVFIGVNFSRLWGIESLRFVIVLVYGYIACFIAFLAAVRLLRFSDTQLQTAPKGIRRAMTKLYEGMTAFRVYRYQLPRLLLATGLSIASQALSFVVFAAMTREMIGGPNLDLYLLAAIFPIGMLITTLPLSPGGLGVGHVAFEYLFQLIGLPEGANVYNVYFVSQTLLNLTGIFIYLLSKEATHSAVQGLDEPPSRLGNVAVPAQNPTP
jgi:uncharacterized protein (TIRG00374 family)